MVTLAFFSVATVNAMERTEIKINIISEQLGLSWAGKSCKRSEETIRLLHLYVLVFYLFICSPCPFVRVGTRASVRCGWHQQDPCWESQLAAGPKLCSAQPVGQQRRQKGQEWAFYWLSVFVKLAFDFGFRAHSGWTLHYSLTWLLIFMTSCVMHTFLFLSQPLMCFAVESLYTALKNIDRADIVTSLEGQVPQPAPGSIEEGACRLGDRDSTLLSPSVINGKTTQTH